MHCTNCGEQLTEESKFCGSCGTGVSQNTADASPQAEAQSPGESSTDKPKTSPMVNGVISLVSIVAIVFMVKYLYSDIRDTLGYNAAEERSARAAQAAQSTQSETAAVASNPDLKFVDGSVEWYTNTMNAAMGANNRQLWIRGNLRNTSADTLTGVKCVATLDLRFANGRKAQAKSNNLCSDAPPSSLDSSWTIKASSAAQIENRKTGGRELWQGPQVDEEFLGYGFSTVLLTIHVTASTPFGDKISTTVFSGEIPPPTHRAAVTLAQNQ